MAQNNADYDMSVSLMLQSSGLPYDLTSADLRMQVRVAPGLEPILQATTGNGYLVITNPPTSGVFSIRIPYSVMNTLSPAQYALDVVNVVNSTNRQLLFSADWLVTAGVTT